MIETPEISCPACGSVDVEQTENEHIAQRPYGGPIKMRILVDRCRACGVDGDFHGANDQVYTTADYLARLSATRPMIDEMNAKGVDDLTFERVIGLEFGTLKKWREEGCSPAEFALVYLAVQEPRMVSALDDTHWWRT